MEGVAISFFFFFFFLGGGVKLGIAKICVALLASWKGNYGKLNRGDLEGSSFVPNVEQLEGKEFTHF